MKIYIHENVHMHSLSRDRFSGVCQHTITSLVKLHLYTQTFHIYTFNAYDLYSHIYILYTFKYTFIYTFLTHIPLVITSAVSSFSLHVDIHYTYMKTFNFIHVIGIHIRDNHFGFLFFSWCGNHVICLFVFWQF